MERSRLTATGMVGNNALISTGMEIQTKMTYAGEQKPSGMGEMQVRNERMRKDDAEKVRVGNKMFKKLHRLPS